MHYNIAFTPAHYHGMVDIRGKYVPKCLYEGKVSMYRNLVARKIFPLASIQSCDLSLCMSWSGTRSAVQIGECRNVSTLLRVDEDMP